MSKEKSLETDKFYCIHLTPIMPANGFMRAGGIVNFHEKLVGNILPSILRRSASEIIELIPQPYSLKEYLEQTMHKTPTTRITLHWALNHIVIPHGESSDYSKCEYLIIEPLKSLKNIFGGLVDDIIQVGDHSLSSEAIVIIPLDKKAAFKLANPNFEGKIETYDPSKVNIRKKGLEIFNQLEIEQVITEVDKELNEYRAKIKDFDFICKKLSELKYLREHFKGKDLERAMLQEGIDDEIYNKIKALPTVKLSDKYVYVGREKIDHKQIMTQLFGENIFLGRHDITNFKNIEKISREAFKVLNVFSAIDIISQINDEDKKFIKGLVIKSAKEEISNASKFINEIEENFVKLKKYLRKLGETNVTILARLEEFELYITSWLKVINKDEDIYYNDELLKKEIAKTIKQPFASRNPVPQTTQIEGKWVSMISRVENNFVVELS